MTRKNFSQTIIKARLKHAAYQCEALMADGTRCLVRADPGRFQADHDNPDGLTGEPTFDNCRILCLAHHAEKTVRDQANIAKAKRNETRHLGVPRARNSMSGPTWAEKRELSKVKSAERSPPGKPPVPGFRPLFREVR